MLKFHNIIEKFIALLIITQIILDSIETIFAQQSQSINGSCVTPDKYHGTCKKLSECPEFKQTISALTHSLVLTARTLIKYQRNCKSINPHDPIICCKDVIEGDIYFPDDERYLSLILKSTTSKTTSYLRNKNNRMLELQSGEISSSPKIKIIDFLFLNDEDDQAISRISQVDDSKNYFQTNSLLNSLPDPSDGCGRTNATFDRIVGGQSAELGAWPWIALMGYKNEFDEISWKCGGSLITQRHVLTAAHCIRRNLYVVRLGEHDLSSDTETKHIDVLINRTKRHPDYSSYDGHADIGVVSLRNPVTFTEFINPVCLPKIQDLPEESLTGYNAFVAGWGRTQEDGNTAEILQQLQIEVYDNLQCSVYYKDEELLLSDRQFDSSVICAGFIAGKKDVCQGDSGGPIMLPKLIGGQNILFQIGTIAFGYGCGRQKLPSIFMNITHYYDWIEDKVKEL